MTTDKKFKARVRERMARTGENYCTARTKLMAESRGATVIHPDVGRVVETVEHVEFGMGLADYVVPEGSRGRVIDVQRGRESEGLRWIVEVENLGRRAFERAQLRFLERREVS